jgi:hypothetical protein
MAVFVRSLGGWFKAMRGRSVVAAVEFVEDQRVQGYLSLAGVGLGLLTWLVRPQLPHGVFVGLVVFAVLLFAYGVLGLALHLAGVGRSRTTPTATEAHGDQLREPEVLLGRRAIRVAREMKEQHAREMAPYRMLLELGDPTAQQYYSGALNSLRFRMGAKWDSLLDDLAARELISREYYGQSAHWVNMTGLDRDARVIEEIGRKLLRNHGVPEDD